MCQGFRVGVFKACGLSFKALGFRVQYLGRSVEGFQQGLYGGWGLGLGVACLRQGFGDKGCRVGDFRVRSG